jgi:hypothetical protein
LAREVNVKSLETYRLQKCSDVRLDDVFFEVLDESDTPLFCVLRDADQRLKLLPYEASTNVLIEFELLKRIVAQVQERYRTET